MTLKTIVYTTSNGWIERDFEAIYTTLRKAPGVTVEPFTVRTIKLPEDVPTFSAGGGTYIGWDWIKEHCPADGHNAVCLHISRTERRKLGLKHPDPAVSLGGAYNRDPGSTFEFLVIAGKADRDYGGMTGFERIFIHELSHGFSHWRGVTDYTHTYDYDLKDIKAIYPWHNFDRWNRLYTKVQELFASLSMFKKKTLYQAALDALGTDASPSDIAPDELGCAESVSNVIRRVLPNFPIVTGTWTLWDVLEHDRRFRRVTIPMPGTIIVAPSGTVAKPKYPGHAGIFGQNSTIMSNDSKTGRFMGNYTLDTWKDRYETKGGYTSRLYQLV